MLVRLLAVVPAHIAEGSVLIPALNFRQMRLLLLHVGTTPSSSFTLPILKSVRACGLELSTALSLNPQQVWSRH